MANENRRETTTEQAKAIALRAVAEGKTIRDAMTMAGRSQIKGFDYWRKTDSDFEDAWLWMSLAVDSLDQSAVCLDNALRVNPANDRAATALLRLRAGDLVLAVQRGRYKLFRDLTLTSMWLLVVLSLCAALATYGALY